MEAVEDGPLDPELGGAFLRDGQMLIQTGEFTVPAGEETYLCWTMTADQAFEARSFSFAGQPVVHHTMLARTIRPEPAGARECEVLFNPNWSTIFGTGAGASELTFPAGTAFKFEADTQFVLQLHLLNTSEEDITDHVEVALGLSEDPNTQPVKIGGFGTTQINLPPHQESSVAHSCTLPKSGRLIGLNPHMHQMGTSLTLELGSTEQEAEQIYAREPYDFDAQTVDAVDMELEQGQFVRVTCNYQNDTNEVVTYGESSLSEMCFLGLFWVGDDPISCVQF